jgi:cobalt/nickel transport system permease protein
MIAPDTWAYTNRLTKTHPAEKCFLAAVMLCLNMSTPAVMPVTCIIFCFMSALTLFKAGIPPEVYIKLLLTPLAFLCVGAGVIMIDLPPDHSAFVTISSQGLRMAINIVCRGLGAVACLLFLCLTTPVADITWLLGRLRLPGLLIELLDLTYRCIFILADSAAKITTAQSSRLGYANMKTTYRSLGSLTAACIIRSLVNAHLMQQAFDSRCGEGPIRVMQTPWPISKKNIIAVMIASMIIAACSSFRVT